jgi:hypothetical protein
MDVIHSCEMLVKMQTTGRYFPEDVCIHLEKCTNNMKYFFVYTIL